MGMPGVLPTINKKAVEYTMMTGLALNSTIAERAKFDRKNYPYPDLMKGYQISQYDQPICVGGSLMIDVDGKQKKIGITRVHLEEDVAKLLHRTTDAGESYSLMDVNRAGCPLMEIVGEPDLSSPEEARLYLVKLRSILQFLGVSTGNMEEGSFRCDANISIRPKGSKELFAKVEVKNMNSFKAVYRALEYEAARQLKVMESGGRLVQETRGWVDDQGITVSQRSKEYAHDYRYFPEPDLPPMVFDRAWVKRIQDTLPELPDAKRDRFMEQFGLPLYDASLLVDTKAMSIYFDNCIKELEGSVSGNELNKKAKKVSNWLLGDFSRLMNSTDTAIENTRITPKSLVELIENIDNGTVGGPASKAVFEEMFNSGRPAVQIIQEKGLVQISDSSELDGIVSDIISMNAQAVQDFKAGKQQTLGFLVGQAMKMTKGRANPEIVRAKLLEKLGGS